MSNQLKKRILSSFFLIGILIFSVSFSDYIFLSFLFVVIILGLIEWIKIIDKINFKSYIKFIHIFIFAVYLFISFIICFNIYVIDKYFFILILTICIFSDVGGYVFGKYFGGKKLTKISPKKTVAGSIGSFFLSFVVFFIIHFYFIDDLYVKLEKVLLFMVPFLISFICQVGDLFISFYKRKAKIKDTGNIIPGHGGVLDRIDGVMFALPIGFIIISIF